MTFPACHSVCLSVYISLPPYQPISLSPYPALYICKTHNIDDVDWLWEGHSLLAHAWNNRPGIRCKLLPWDWQTASIVFKFCSSNQTELPFALLKYNKHTCWWVLERLALLLLLFILWWIIAYIIKSSDQIKHEVNMTYIIKNQLLNSIV